MILTSMAGQRRVLGERQLVGLSISHISSDTTVTRRDVLASARNSWSGGRALGVGGQDTWSGRPGHLECGALSISICQVNDGRHIHTWFEHNYYFHHR